MRLFFLECHGAINFAYYPLNETTNLTHVASEYDLYLNETGGLDSHLKFYPNNAVGLTKKRLGSDMDLHHNTSLGEMFLDLKWQKMDFNVTEIDNYNEYTAFTYIICIDMKKNLLIYYNQ